MLTRLRVAADSFLPAQSSQMLGKTNDRIMEKSGSKIATEDFKF
jgi:hypothetical protein